jgi:membrane protein
MAMALDKISAARLKRLPAQLKDRAEEHNLTLLAAGVAFYAFLAAVPTLVVIVSVYGLFADPADIERHVQEAAGALPDEARALLVSQLRSITGTTGGSLTVAVLVSIVIALWSASTGMASLMKGVAAASGTADHRNYAVKRGLAVALTLGAIVFIVVSLITIAFVPALLAETRMSSGPRLTLDVLRFPAIAALMMFGLGVMYHHATPAAGGRPRVVSWGALIATGLWIVSSIGFSYYTSNFGSYNETYGSLGAIVIVLLWLWLSAVVVLLGAEIDAQLDTGRKRAG